MYTKRDTVKLLCKSIVTRLENQGSIEFPPRLRQIVHDEVYGLIGPYIATDEDIKDKVISKLGANSEALANNESSESDQFKAAKAVIKAQLGDDVLGGFYFQRPVKTLAHSISQYLMRSSHIDEVYAEDQDLEKSVVEIIQKFDAANIA